MKSAAAVRPAASFAARSAVTRVRQAPTQMDYSNGKVTSDGDRKQICGAGGVRGGGGAGGVALRVDGRAGAEPMVARRRPEGADAIRPIRLSQRPPPLPLPLRCRSASGVEADRG